MLRVRLRSHPDRLPPDLRSSSQRLREDVADCKAAIKTTQKLAKEQAKAFDETAKIFCTLLDLFNRCLGICRGEAERLNCGARSQICMP